MKAQERDNGDNQNGDAVDSAGVDEIPQEGKAEEEYQGSRYRTDGGQQQEILQREKRRSSEQLVEADDIVNG